LNLSVLAWTECYRTQELVEAVRKLEKMGYHELWLPELNGREPFSTCGFLLNATTSLRVSTGIANVYVRDAVAVAQARRTLAELSGNRFSLGLGVSHPNLVEPRGHIWQKPVPKLRTYLSDIKAAEMSSPDPEMQAPIIIAAHAKGLWSVAAEHADGILTNLLMPQSIRNAREVIGEDKSVHSLLRCVADPDPVRAREKIRASLGFYLALPAYHRAWSACGFGPEDWCNGGSDRLIDAIAVHGSSADILRGLQRFSDAGTTHGVLAAAGRHSSDSEWDWELLEALAPYR
jgi:probable F420-dependent oxidoreductase